MIGRLRQSPGPLIGVLGFALVSVLLTLPIVGTLGTGGGEDPQTYHAVFTDASGLRPGDDVRIAGVKVGRVVSRELVEGHAKVTFTVEGEQRLSGQTTATISYLNLIGQRYIGLAAGQRGEGRLRPGGTIPVSRTRPAIDLTAIFNAFKPLFETLQPADVNRLVKQVVAIMQGEGGTIRHLMQETATLTHHLADRDQLIGSVLDNLSLVMETTLRHREELTGMVDDLGGLVHGLAGDRRQIGAAIDGMNDLTTATSSLLGAAREPLTRAIAKLRRFAAALAAQRGPMEEALQAAPVMLKAYARSMSYGTWLNVYICNLSIQTKSGQSLLRDRDLPLGNSEVCS